MLKIPRFLPILLLFFSLFAFGQDVKIPKKYTRSLDKADVLFNTYIFKQAIEAYQKALTISQHDSSYILLQIAESYRLINNSETAKTYYDRVFPLGKMTHQDMANYAQVLMLTSNYEEAKIIADSIGTSLARLENANQTSDIKIDTAAYFMENLVVNGDKGDFSPAYFGEGIVFVSNREWKRLLQSKYYWDESFFLDLYFTQNVDSTADYFSRFSKKINTIYHEGPAAFYNDDTRMIFTRNNFNQGRKHLSDDGVNKLKLFYSEKPSGEKDWSKPVELWFNDDQYSVGHPTVTKDGSKMYFASDMPGSVGGADIWYTQYKDSTWTRPVNMGATINTSADELFPFIFQDSILYFASKGHLGLGGLDIYRVNLKTPNSKPENMGQPLNSQFDDFGLIQRGNIGYFSSNRPGGKGEDDIYKFTYTEIIPEIPSYIVAIEAVNSETGDRIPDARVDIEDTVEHELIVAQNVEGVRYFKTLENMHYSAHARHHGYFSNEINFEIGADLEVDTLSFKIPLEEIIIGKAIELENIYYDVNKAEIRDDAAIELNKLVKILVDNPEIKIELSSHTDSRGSDLYNMNLSQRRADSAVAYIISKGIDSNRITAKGYGETKLVNQCSNGVKCSLDEHQKNRRTEFSVTEAD